MLSRTLLALALAAATAGAAGAQPRAPAHSFTIEQVLSAPFPAWLTAADAGGRVAWVFNDKGSRNVWVAEPGAKGYAARAVTAYRGDDGYDLGEVAFSPDGRQLVYVRGGSLEGGPPVNPLSLPSGAVGAEVWAVAVDGGAPRRIGPGVSPAVSPRGDVVAYIQAGQLMTAPLAGEGPAAPLFKDRGQARGFAWSPDGGRLAFVSARSGHSFVGVYDLAARTLVWLGPGFDRDMLPEWSPDGRRVAFVRIAANHAGVFADSRQAQPWSLWIADAATGEARKAFEASPGAGSAFHPVESERNLFWMADGRLVFPWERSGWLQFYALPSAGGAPVRLTQGDFEIFGASLSADRRRLVYASNQGDIDRRHLWEIPAGAGGPRQLTRGATIEDSPVVTADGQVVGLQADARRPLRPVWVAGSDRTVELAPGSTPPQFPTARLVEPQPVVFEAADGLKVHGQLFLPPKGRAGRGPAILFFHGGPFRQMLLGWHPMDAYAYMYAMNQYLADAGYVVLSVNYRASTGYGLDFREAERFGPQGGSELNDIKGAVEVLRARADVDPKRIGVWGGSYGGLMTALTLSRMSDAVAAGVDYSGVYDWTKMGPLGPAPGPNAMEIAAKASPAATVDRWTSPVLVVHPDDDRNVPFAQSVDMVEDLRKHKVEVEELVLPDEVHDLLLARSWRRLFHAADDFFARRLAR